MGNRTVSSASTLASPPTHALTENEVEWADTSAVAGRGRRATIWPRSSDCVGAVTANSNNAIQPLPVRPSRPANPAAAARLAQDQGYTIPEAHSTQGSYPDVVRCVQQRPIETMQPTPILECPTHMTAYTAVATNMSETARSACGRVMLPTYQHRCTGKRLYWPHGCHCPQVVWSRQAAC